jgi:hypothetical protein
MASRPNVIKLFYVIYAFSFEARVFVTDKLFPVYSYKCSSLVRKFMNTDKKVL